MELNGRMRKYLGLKVSDVMTENPLTVDPSDTLDQVG
jgi:hypothetical protein